MINITRRAALGGMVAISSTAALGAQKFKVNEVDLETIPASENTPAPTPEDRIREAITALSDILREETGVDWLILGVSDGTAGFGASGRFRVAHQSNFAPDLELFATAPVARKGGAA